MSQIPALTGDRALEHNAAFESGYGLTAKGLTAALIAVLGRTLGAKAVTVAMADAAHALVLAAAGAAETRLEGLVYLVDPDSSGAAEVLTYADTEAELDGLLNIIINTGGEAITINNDAAAQVGHIPNGGAALVFCDGTTIHVINIGAASFASSEQTGTGSEQTVPHGFGQIPTRVWTSITEDAGTGLDVAYGTHTSADLKFTVTSGVKFRAFAIL